MRSSIIGLAGFLFAVSATPAFAQEETEEESSPITLSANVAITTDYRFRGAGFSDGDFAVQGGFDIGHESGFYVGTWASSIEDSATFGSMELDIYGGWSGEITDGITADAGLLYYVYPNGSGASDYFEPYASLEATVGPAAVKVGVAHAWSGQNSLGGNDNTYVYTDLSVGIPDTPVTVTAHAGYNDGSLSIGTDGDYTDYSLTVDYAVTENITASLGYVTTETDLPSLDGFNDDAVVFTVSASF